MLCIPYSFISEYTHFQEYDHREYTYWHMKLFNKQVTPPKCFSKYTIHNFVSFHVYNNITRNTI